MPNDADLALQLGHFYKRSGRFYEAMAAYDRAITLATDWDEPRRERQALLEPLCAQLATEGFVSQPTTPPEPLPAQHVLHYLEHGAMPYAAPGFDSYFYAQAYPDVADSGLTPFQHFVRHGKTQGRLPSRPKLTSMDPYTVLGIEKALGQSVKWDSQGPNEITDVWAAARFCVDLLSNSSALRRRFPRALSEGYSGCFARWLLEDGRRQHGLSASATAVIAELFQQDIAAPILQSCLARTELRLLCPFGLTPVGLADLLRLGFRADYADDTFRIEQIRWFAIARTEDPAGELVRTYLFSPMLQSRFPGGLTVFGRQALADWLQNVCGLEGEWVDPASWPCVLTFTEQIHLAYAAEPAWRDAHPTPFANGTAVLTFFKWIEAHPGTCEDARKWLRTAATRESIEALLKPGVNVLAHFCYPSGLRTSAESLIEG